MDDGNKTVDSNASNEGTEDDQWFPRDILRRTNWQYRADALRVSDIRDINVILEVVEAFKEYAFHFLVWAHVVVFKLRRAVSASSQKHYRKMFNFLKIMIQYFISEGYYCYYLDCI